MEVQEIKKSIENANMHNVHDIKSILLNIAEILQEQEDWLKRVSNVASKANSRNIRYR